MKPYEMLPPLSSSGAPAEYPSKGTSVEAHSASPAVAFTGEHGTIAGRTLKPYEMLPPLSSLAVSGAHPNRVSSAAVRLGCLTESTSALAGASGIISGKASKAFEMMPQCACVSRHPRVGCSAPHGDRGTGAALFLRRSGGACPRPESAEEEPHPRGTSGLVPTRDGLSLAEVASLLVSARADTYTEFFELPLSRMPSLKGWGASKVARPISGTVSVAPGSADPCHDANRSCEDLRRRAHQWLSEYREAVQRRRQTSQRMFQCDGPRERLDCNALLQSISRNREQAPPLLERCASLGPGSSACRMLDDVNREFMRLNQLYQQCANPRSEIDRVAGLQGECRARFEEYDQAVADITWMESFWAAYMSLLAERASEISSTSSCQCAFVPQRRPWGIIVDSIPDDLA